MRASHPFRFGVVARNAVSAQQWAATARRAEDLGYTSFLVPDHFGASVSPVPALAVAGYASTTLRLGSFVFDNDYRHPALLQKDVATLDLLTGGRFEFGIGAGGDRPEYEQAGIPFDPPEVRVERLGEALAMIKGLFRSAPAEPFSFSGAHYRLAGLSGGPPPVQRPHPPILIGGGGRHVLSLAAREADIVGFTFWRHRDGSPNGVSMTPAATDQQVAWVREAAGDRFDTLELNLLIQWVEVTEHPEPTVNWLAERWNLSPALVRESAHALVGSVPHLVEDLQSRRDRYGISYIAVFDQFMEAFAPVVQHLAGK
jgi:probable F420-dependent oxidoreductase